MRSMLLQDTFFLGHCDQRRLKAGVLVFQKMKNAGNGDLSDRPNALRVLLKEAVFEVIVVNNAKSFED